MQTINESIAFEMLKNKVSLFTIVEEDLPGNTPYNKVFYAKKEQVTGLTYIDEEGQSKMALVLRNGTKLAIDNLSDVFANEVDVNDYLEQLAINNGYTAYKAITVGETVPYLVLGKVEYKYDDNLLCACRMH